MPISHFSTEPLSWFRNHPMDTTTHNPKFQVQNYNGVVSENDYTNSFSYSYSDQDRHSAVTSEDPHHHHYQRHISQVSGPPHHHHRNHSNINCKEPMFEKPLTPSDVGKLNRLVIPKQHAEKYFPLNGNGAVINDPTSSGGTLLSFEDEAGKSWRFRYSYWNSSQSYVLTKGWSRYVKEKRLDAGDVVFFERHVTCPDRLFIGWRRRAATADGSSVQDSRAASVTCYGARDGGLYAQDSSSSHSHQATALGFTTSTISQFQPDRFHAETAVQVRSQNTTLGNTNNKDNNNNSKRRFRLFGVNLECGQPSTAGAGGGDCQTTSSEGSSSFSGQYHQHHLQGPSPPSYSNYIDQGNYHHSQYHYQMDINFPQGVNQMGNRLR